MEPLLAITIPHSFMRILVTGASGFVGSALLRHLAPRPDLALRAALRTAASGGLLPAGVEVVETGDLGPQTNWHAALTGIDTVVHCAARVHVMNETAGDPLSLFRRVNVEGSLALAQQARDAGVKRLVFLSSIKVNGEQTAPGRPFTADDTPAPVDAYGISKMEAEQALMALAAEGGIEVVVIRPVLVYGPGVKANFRSMMRWLQKGIPLPLGAITGNRRSLVALDNLVDLMTLCMHHPAAANEIFLVSDGEDLSTTELLRRMGQALGSPARLIPVPAPVLECGARLLGKGAVAQRLCGSLQVEIGKTRSVLDWSPPVSTDVALRRAASAVYADAERR